MSNVEHKILLNPTHCVPQIQHENVRQKEVEKKFNLRLYHVEAIYQLVGKRLRPGHTIRLPFPTACPTVAFSYVGWLVRPHDLLSWYERAEVGVPPRQHAGSHSQMVKQPATT